MEPIAIIKNVTELLHGHASHLRNLFPIHFAASEGDVQRLCSLLADAEPSDLNVEDDFFGWTPTHWAAYFGQLACLRILSDKTPSQLGQPSTKYLWTPLHLAAQKRHGHCLQWLLQNGVEINCKDHLGDTPLHKAARIGSIECASLLISQGASMEVLNYQNMTPAYLAEHNGHKECAAHIRQLQFSYSSRLPKLLPSSSNQHSEPADMDCDMDTSEATTQTPEETLANEFHPFSTPPASQNGFHPVTDGFAAQAQAPPQNHFHPATSGFPAEPSMENGFHPASIGFPAQVSPQNGFHPFSGHFAPQEQPVQQNGFCGPQMNGGVLFQPRNGSVKRGREEDEESQQKRPCPEARFEANNNSMVMLNSSSLQELHSSIVASLDYDRRLCENVGLPNASS